MVEWERDFVFARLFVSERKLHIERRGTFSTETSLDEDEPWAAGDTGRASYLLCSVFT